MVIIRWQVMPGSKVLAGGNWFMAHGSWLVAGRRGWYMMAGRQGLVDGGLLTEEAGRLGWYKIARRLCLIANE